MTKSKIISNFYSAFALRSRPDHFTKFDHCPECAEHDESLRAVELSAIGATQVGYIGYGPISFLTAEALAYCMPRFLEMVLLDGQNDQGDDFIGDFILQLVPRENFDRFSGYTNKERTVVLDTLDYIYESMHEVVKRNSIEKELEDAILYWSKKTT
ncbi:hypothetical protein HUF18_06925 [Thalassolituus sp. ST750PaO-4]|uniref:hypothetical protein n=1 Tax=Thalassolituus sp. ST750PaO-4 TaxID=2742965 RepID=UPI001CE2ECE7|nr:hypothetical protein [Thalassolituus sp. ST750PaO-4]MCA6059507.1 hypothetical protein [Thalassolituus sp. ST750PaO-4]